MILSRERAFLCLIGAQALHSVEEYVNALWEVLAPARFVSGLFSSDLSTGFAIVNIVIVAFGLWCYVVPVRRANAAAVPLIWFWIILEAANGTGHLLFAAAAGGYFPGAYTAPLLLASSIYLVSRLHRGAQP